MPISARDPLIKFERRRSAEPRSMSACGAFEPLPEASAKVSSPNRQRSLGPGRGNRAIGPASAAEDTGCRGSDRRNSRSSDTDDCRSVVVDDVTDAAFRIGRRGRIRSIFWPGLSIADHLAKTEWVVQSAQREVEVAAEAVLLAEAEAIAGELAGRTSAPASRGPIFAR
jgi:hypothetical protein